MSRPSGLFPVVARFREMLRNGLPALHELCRLFLVLLKSRFEIIGVHPVHVCRRAALHQLAQNCDILFNSAVHEIRPLFLSCGHGSGSVPSSQQQSRIVEFAAWDS